MTLQNRVLPTGEIVAAPFRGTLMGNRGILHDEAQTLKTRRWQHPHWVTCVLHYKDWHRPVMTPHNYTELFFLDEATALAAGHRPCGLCRRADYNRFRQLWDAAHGPAPDLMTLDRHMHRDRVTRTRQQVRHTAPLKSLPDGTFILHDGAPHLVRDARLLRAAPDGYNASLPRPTSGEATVLTPACTVAVLTQGYRPALHPSASPG